MQHSWGQRHLLACFTATAMVMGVVLRSFCISLLLTRAIDICNREDTKDQAKVLHDAIVAIHSSLSSASPSVAAPAPMEPTEGQGSATSCTTASTLDGPAVSPEDVGLAEQWLGRLSDRDAAMLFASGSSSRKPLQQQLEEVAAMALHVQQGFLRGVHHPSTIGHCWQRAGPIKARDRGPYLPPAAAELKGRRFAASSKTHSIPLPLKCSQDGGRLQAPRTFPASRQLPTIPDLGLKDLIQGAAASSASEISAAALVLAPLFASLRLMSDGTESHGNGGAVTPRWAKPRSPGSKVTPRQQLRQQRKERQLEQRQQQQVKMEQQRQHRYKVLSRAGMMLPMVFVIVHKMLRPS